MSYLPPTFEEARQPHRARVTIAGIKALQQRGDPIVMVTAYDHPSARAADLAGIDIVLVGDSAATTMLGYPSTREVSLDEMLMLTHAVRRGLTSPLLVGDLPFGTYEDSPEQAVETSRSFIDAGCDAVKLEGAGPMLTPIRAIIGAGIPVMGHVGLLPQSAKNREEYRARGRTADEARDIVRDARELERAGCFSVVIEAVPPVVAEVITSALDIPTIGIGAGSCTDGQVLVWHDLLGILDDPSPRFVRRFARLRETIVDALSQYADDVRARRYPAVEHTYKMALDEESRFKALLAGE